MPHTDQGWQSSVAAARYAHDRFRTARAAGRDARLVARLLARHASPGGGRSRILDVPCGTGRLRPLLEEHGDLYAGVDVSAAMLEEARSSHRRLGLARGSVVALPFPDDAFDVVVCCRYLHHLQAAPDLERAVRELVRVSRGLVIASFFDTASWQAWRRKLAPRRAIRSRRAIGKAAMRDAFAAAGARVVGFAHSCRFVSQQVFLAAEKCHHR